MGPKLPILIAIVMAAAGCVAIPSSVIETGAVRQIDRRTVDPVSVERLKGEVAALRQKFEMLAAERNTQKQAPADDPGLARIGSDLDRLKREVAGLRRDIASAQGEQEKALTGVSSAQIAQIEGLERRIARSDKLLLTLAKSIARREANPLPMRPTVRDKAQLGFTRTAKTSPVKK